MHARPMLVLLIEDDSDDFLITRDMIADIDDAPYALEWKKDFDSGLEALRKGDYSACLLDYRLGEHTGLEFLKEAQKWGNTVPIILFTNQVDRALEREAMAAGAADFLVKTGTNHESLRRALSFAMERNRATHAVRERDRIFRALFDNAQDAMLITGATGSFTDANAAALELTGLARDSLLGKTLAQLASRDAEPDLDGALWKAFLEAGRSSGDLEVVRPDGSSRFAEYKGAATVLSGQHLFVLRDVTDQKALRARMAISDRMASVGTLAAGLAHEINNPLAVVVGYLDMAVEAAKASPENSEVLELLGHVVEASQRVVRTVKDLKLFSQTDDKGSHRVDLKATMESSLRMAWNEIRHRAKVVQAYADAPLMNVNEGRLGQVFLNLLVNAAQATPPGHADKNEIFVGIGVKGGRVAIEVKDSGKGIGPQELTRIFEPFYSTKAMSGGTGLGLAICKGIVEEMGGEIVVTSELGVGSSFTLWLPLALACAPASAGAGPAPSSKGRRGRVLVIDDEASLLDVMNRTLSREHDTVALQDPREGLRRVEAGEEFDAILCDMMMPEMSGVEFFKRLEKLDAKQARRLIFVTGGAFTPAERGQLDSAANATIEKPFSREELMAKVRALVGP